MSNKVKTQAKASTALTVVPVAGARMWNGSVIDSMFDAGFTYGGAKRAAILAVSTYYKSIKGKGRDEVIKAMGVSFEIGDLAQRLGVTREQAEAIAEKKPVTKTSKPGPTVKTKVEHGAWRASVTDWNRIGEAAGLPKRVQKAKEPTAPKADAIPDAPIVIEAVQLPTVETPAQAISWAMSLAALASAFEARNAVIFNKEECALLRGVFADLREGMKEVIGGVEKFESTQS